MPRKGEQLEEWAREHIRGDSTVNSGATFNDADMKVDGVGGRLYEFKSSEEYDGLSLRRDHIHILLQRAIKLNRDPVFIVQNSLHDRYAVIPLRVLAAAIGKWDAIGFNPEEVLAVRHAFQGCPVIESKGDNIRIKPDVLKNSINKHGVVFYKTKNGISWVILEANTWLTIAGDKKHV